MRNKSAFIVAISYSLLSLCYMTLVNAVVYSTATKGWLVYAVTDRWLMIDIIGFLGIALAILITSAYKSFAISFGTVAAVASFILLTLLGDRFELVGKSGHAYLSIILSLGWLPLSWVLSLIPRTYYSFDAHIDSKELK